MSVGKRDYLPRLQILLVFEFLNGTAKIKLAILAFLYCGEIMKKLVTTVKCCRHAAFHLPQLFEQHSYAIEMSARRCDLALLRYNEWPFMSLFLVNSPSFSPLKFGRVIFHCFSSFHIVSPIFLLFHLCDSDQCPRWCSGYHTCPDGERPGFDPHWGREFWQIV